MRNLFKGLVYAVLITGFFTLQFSWAAQEDDIMKELEEIDLILGETQTQQVQPQSQPQAQPQLQPQSPPPQPKAKPVIAPEENKGVFPQGESRAVEKLKKENAQLRQQLATTTKDKASIYQELGDTYTEMKLYDQAIDAYKQALTFDPNIAEVYYRLGLLYRHSRNDGKKGIEYLKKYLKLNPEAKDKRQIEYLIDMMTKSSFPFTDDLKKGWDNVW